MSSPEPECFIRVRVRKGVEEGKGNKMGEPHLKTLMVWGMRE